MRGFGFKLACILLVGLFTPFGVSHGASTQWQDLGGASVRLIAIIDPETLRLKGAVDVHLKPDWSTYWRNPGTSGIPPDFHFAANGRSMEMRVFYPTPSIIGETLQNSYAGYKNRVRFPFSGMFYLNRVWDLKVDMVIGLCETICIPARASFQLPRSTLLQSDRISTALIKEAFNSVPRRVPFSKLVLKRENNPQSNSVHITIQHGGNREKLALLAWPAEHFPLPGKLIEANDRTALFELKAVETHMNSDAPLNLLILEDGDGIVAED